MKNNKKLLTIIITILILALAVVTFFVISGSGSKKENDEPKKDSFTPLMYEVTKEGSTNKMYLIGSMHLVDLNKVEFPKYLIDAYNDSDYLAVEADVVAVLDSPELMQKYYLDNAKYKDGTTVKDHMEEENYNKLVKFLNSKGYSIEQVKDYKLDQIESVISSLMLKDAKIASEVNGLDVYYLRKAKAENKTILEVESMDFQTELENSFPDRLHEISIIDMIDNYDEQVKQLKQLTEIWKNGDPEELVQILDFEEKAYDKLSDSDKAIQDDYNYRFMTLRNINMTKKFIEYFNEDKKVLFMVGAAHLIGDDGIVKLLEQEGYTLKQINK